MSADIQKQAVESIDRNVFISAGAGTGKTSVLVQRFAELLSKGKAEVPEIAAITFTEKAANEMKNRIRGICAEMSISDNIWEKHKRDLENSRIGTIHGFCARIIRENSILLGIDPESVVLDELSSSALLNKIVHSSLLKLLESEDPDTVFIISEYGFKYTKGIFSMLLKNRIDIDLIMNKHSELDDNQLKKYWKKLSDDLTELDLKSIQTERKVFNIYRKIKESYSDYKRKEKLLDFDDLIIYTRDLLKENKSVRRHYQKLIKYILVDEFQDTDFHQREIIFFIAEDGSISMADTAGDIILSKDKLFIVGDSNQSIYRFRGADVSVFEDTKRISEKHFLNLNMDINMRSLPKNIDFFNKLFGDVMGRDRKGKKDYESTHLDLQAGRLEDSEKNTIEFLSIKPNEDASADETRKMEAELISKRILQMIGKERFVFEKGRREVQFKDIAILFRAMTSIKIYEDAFRKYCIPYYITAGSGFYARQELKDILNYLKILENPDDNIALAGVLRSPFVCVSDNTLYWLSQCPDKSVKAPQILKEGLTVFHSQNISKDDNERLKYFIDDYLYFKELKDKSSISFLLNEIIGHTHYDSVLFTQYMGEQKVSNLNKLIDTARNFESKGIFTLEDFIDYIDELVTSEAREGEAALSEEESNTIKIMTIHKAKGLEFPVVIIPDISRKTQPVTGKVLFDREFTGLGLKIKDENGELIDSPKRKLIKQEIEKKELAESKRLLYVASTRARDYLIYSGNFSSNKNSWAEWLSEYYSNPCPNIKITEDVPMVEAKPRPLNVRGLASNIDSDVILKQIKPVPLPPKMRFTATELSDYKKSPSTYKERHILGIPELTEEPKLGIKTHDFLKKWEFDENELPLEEDIKKLVNNFIKDPIYKEIKNSTEKRKEIPIIYKYKNYIIEGIIDLLYKKKDGNWVIVDYKTDNITEEEIPERALNYEIQLQVYAIGLVELNIIPERAVIFFLKAGIAHNVNISGMEDKLDKLLADITKQKVTQSVILTPMKIGGRISV